MRRILALSLAAAAFSLTARASPIGDAQEGDAALARGDYPEAVRLLTRALDSGALSNSDRELAYVKRAEAYADEKDNAAALADLDRAVAIDPTDREATDLRDSLKSPAGPTLAETLSFIQSQVVSNGLISYIAPYHVANGGTDGSNTFVVETSNIRPFPEACNLTFHFKSTRDGQVMFDSDAGVPFSQVVDIKSISGEQYTNEQNARAGHPELVAHDLQPQLTVVVVSRADGQQNLFYFLDQAIADRVGKAIAHAAQLCGGLKPQPF